MDEIESTFLVKFLPKDLHKFPKHEIIDIYFPKTDPHPAMRIRKNGDKYEITRKHQAREGDASHLIEQNIFMNEAEFNVLNTINGLRVHKMRYNYAYNGLTAEIDVFLDDLKGLVSVDFEFKNLAQQEKFALPDFCLCDVTQESFVAGGKLCGKKFSEIEPMLKKFGAKKIDTCI